MRIMHIALGGCLSAAPIRYGLTEDTGGHIAYVLGATERQAERTDVSNVDIVTRRFYDDRLGSACAKEVEMLGPKRRILRIRSDRSEYLEKNDLTAEIPSLAKSFIRLLERSQLPDVIHAHFADAAVLARAARERFQIPWVFSSHSLGLQKHARGPEHRSRVAREKDAVQGADAIIASSRDEAERQIADYDPAAAGRTFRVSPGVSIPDVHSVNAAKRLIAPFLRNMRKPIVLAIARPVRKKNLAGLLRAYAGSAELRDKANLVIVAGLRERIGSTGSETSQTTTELFDLVDRHDLWGQVALPRAHDSCDIAGLYALAAKGGVFANPAFCEPFGLTVVEALQNGVPVVATQNGGPSEIIDAVGFGRCVDPNCEPDIAKACLDFINQPDRAACQRAAKRRASVAFSWKSWAADVEAVYRALRKVHRPRRPAERLLISDLDGTLTGDRAGIEGLMPALRADDRELVLATGRSIGEARRVLRSWEIPEPATIISSVGSEIWTKDTNGVGYSMDVPYSQWIGSLWDRAGVLRAVEESGVPLQQPFEQRRWKVSCFGKADDARRLSEALARRDVDAKVIASHGRLIDVLPSRAGKAAAAAFVAKRLCLKRSDCIAAGDSGNDRDLLEWAGAAVVPANAHPEIDSVWGRRVYRSPLRYAAGVVEGLAHHKHDDIHPTLLAAE